MIRMCRDVLSHLAEKQAKMYDTHGQNGQAARWEMVKRTWGRGGQKTSRGDWLCAWALQTSSEMSCL